MKRTKCFNDVQREEKGVRNGYFLSAENALIQFSQSCSRIRMQALTSKLQGSQIQQRGKKRWTSCCLYGHLMDGTFRYSAAIVASALLLSKTETHELLPKLLSNPYTRPPRKCIYLSLKTLKLTHIVQGAPAPCQGKRSGSPFYLMNDILRLNSLLSAYFSCIKLPKQ